MFVVYNYTAPNYKPRYFETERGAKIARGRNNKNPDKMACGVLTLEAFNNTYANKKVQVKNLMTGKMIEIMESDRNTCNDPSQERFWSM
jgi:hypothetical protein